VKDAVKATLRRGARALFQTDSGIARRYLSGDGTKKLQIGCGQNVLDGWLNSDFRPKRSHIMHLDATRAFPLPDNAFDFVFSEHMIEHVPYVGGVNMLNECFRVLKPGGTLRISTPDLLFLIDLYRPDKSPLQQSYIDCAVSLHSSYAPVATDTFVINNYVRDWGHLFIYDEKTLADAMRRAGFSEIRKFQLNESDSEALRGLENESRMPEGFLALESLTLQAVKPR
jgi:predicted SAM-dependent methyltransferase